MRILVTGAGGNVGRGIVSRLRATHHDVVLSDVDPLPVDSAFEGMEFVQVDLQAGFGLERAVRDCDLVLHLPAWHGIHARQRTEVDYWRLNVDGSFWTLQAAAAAGVRRLVFLSSMAWHDHYGKYGFTKRIGEELCEYYRRNHGMRYVAIRPADFTPWGSDFVNRYGARLLYGGVDRADVLDCVELAVRRLASDSLPDDEPEGLVVNAVRPNAFSAGQLDGWETDPIAVCESVFPRSRELIHRYAIDIGRRPTLVELEGAESIEYAPRRHFGTFLEQLRELDERGEDVVRATRCPY